MPILFELSALDQGGSAVVRRYGHTAYMSLPTDSPGNAVYDPFLLSAGPVERQCWSRGATTGRSSAGFGAVKVQNCVVSGVWQLDSRIRDAVDGQPFSIRLGDGAALAGYPVCVSGIIKSLQIGWNTIDYDFNDQASFVWDLPLQTRKYQGTNAGSAGLEGLKTDIAGNPWPVLLGYVSNISPTVVNAFSLDYHVDDGGAKLPMTLTVYSTRNVVSADGTLGANGATHSTLASFLASTPASSKYTSYAGPEGWYFRRGGGIVGRITCDVSEGAAAERTIAQCVMRLLARKTPNSPGYVLSAIAGAAALDGKNSGEVGNWTSGDTTIGSFLEPILSSGGAFLADQRDSSLLLGRLDDPDTMPSITTISLWQALDISISPSNDAGIGLRIGSTGLGVFASNAVYEAQGTVAGLPVWRVMVDYGLNYTTMNETDLPLFAASGATPAQVADLWYCKNKFRTVTAEDSSVLARHIKAPEFDMTSLYRYLADAQTEATRQLALRKIQRCVVAVTIPSAMASSIELGSAFTMRIPRFGWDAGRNFFCLGIVDNFGSSTTTASTTIYGWGAL